MHPLGESCGPLTLEESIDLLRTREKVISDLEKRVCELESELSNEKVKHSDYEIGMSGLLCDKDAIIRDMEKKLEERPTQKQVNDLRDELTMLQFEIGDKTSLLEMAEKKIAELSAKIEKPGNKRIPIFKRIFSRRSQEAGTSTNSVGSITTNNTTPLLTPVVRMASTARNKLIFFRKGNSPEFDVDDLLRAPSEVLGKGTFGTSYKTVLESGQTVVVKRLKNINLPENEFRENAARIGKLNHKNILPLLSYYYSKDEKLLVYDFMIILPLSKVLHEDKGSWQDRLNWETRAKIILSVSESINYIHSMGPTFCHGDIRSSNVLLSLTYEAILSDHGIYSLSTAFLRSYSNRGYCAPELSGTRKMSQEGDVYSFGVLVIEILIGKSPYQMRSLDWVGMIREKFDVKLLGNQRAREDIIQLTQLALDCAVYNPVDRPRMADVAVMIQAIIKNV